ncbi:MAG: ABC transporter permease [Bacillota bacterium]
MNNSLKVAGWELKKNIKSKMFLIMAFIFPVLIALIGGASGYFTSQGEISSGAKSVGIIDQTGRLKNDLKEELTNEGYQVDFFEKKAEEEIKEIIEEKDLVGMFIVPANSVEKNQVLFYFKELSKRKATFFENVLKPVLAEKRLEEEGYDADQILKLVKQPDVVFKSLQEEESLIEFMLPFGLVFMMILATMISGGMLYQSIVKEKSDRIVELTLSSISANDLMMGKIFGYAGLGIIQIIVWLIVGLLAGHYLFDISLNPLVSFRTVYIVIYFVLGYFMIAGLYAILGSAMKDSKSSNQVGGLINIIPILPLYFSQLFINGGQGVIVKFFTYCPLFTPVTMLLRLAFGQPTRLELAITIMILVVFDYLVIQAASKVFKTAILMYGQNISFKKLIKLIKPS